MAIHKAWVTAAHEDGGRRFQHGQGPEPVPPPDRDVGVDEIGRTSRADRPDSGLGAMPSAAVVRSLAQTLATGISSHAHG